MTTIDRKHCVYAKRGFTSRAEVDAWINDWRKRKRPWQPRLHPYQCNACGNWHVTKKKQGQAKRRRS